MIKAVIFDMYETLITLFESPAYFSTQMAVDAKLRSRGYGSEILAELRTQYPNRKILVTIDPPSRDGVDIKTRRKQFYIRNGFNETGYYIKSFGNEQEILLSGGKFSKVGFSVFLLIYSCFAICPRIEKHDLCRRSIE